MTKKTKKIKKTEDKPSINFATVWDSDYWMSSNGMYCGFNMPDALTDSESAHNLPPYAKRKHYLADEYPACPKNWIPSEGRKTSYFVPVKEGQGMWLDFTKSEEHKYHVAIVISIQGINPITGLPCKDAALEQYIDTCPKHNKAFGPHRFCDECGYKWPKQNYICTTATPSGNLWLDGFRAANGVVRQYILTMDKIKGVASNVIGEDRVFAVGISFFLSNSPKPVVMQTSFTRGGLLMGKGTNNQYVAKSAPNFFKQCATSNWQINTSKGRTKGSMTYTSSLGDANDIGSSNMASNTDGGAFGMNAVAPSANVGAAGAAPSEEINDSVLCSSSSNRDWMEQDMCRGIVLYDTCEAKDYMSPKVDVKEIDRSVNSVQNIKSVNVKKVEIGAGANISQHVYDDPEPLEFWRKEPEAIICINYALEKDAEKIIRAGKVSLEGHGEAFLKDIPKGNKEKKELETK